jgi:FkbM family methyltransferase
MGNAAHVAGHTLRILRMTGGRDRGMLLKDFLRIKGRELVPRQGGERLRERFLGYDVELLDYGHFVDMLEEIFVQQVYEVPLPDRPRILDCGSNIGISVLYFKNRHPSAHLVAFEPHPIKADVLARNVERNALADVQVVPKAVTGVDGMVELQIDPDDPGSLVSGTRRKQRTSTRVDATSLSPYVQEPVDLIKLDVEGDELPVLRELADSGALGLVSQLVVEVHHHLDPTEENLAAIFAVLEGTGFAVQVRGLPTIPFVQDELQDLLVYAYRR